MPHAPRQEPRSRVRLKSFPRSTLAGRPPPCHTSSCRSTFPRPPHAPNSIDARLGVPCLENLPPIMRPLAARSAPAELPLSIPSKGCQTALHCSRGTKPLPSPDSIAEVMLHLRQCGAANRHPQECEATWLPFCGRRQPFPFGCDALQHTSPSPNHPAPISSLEASSCSPPRQNAPRA